MALANDTLIAGDLLAKGVFTASEEEEHGDLGGVRPRTPNKDRLEKRWARRSGMGRWKAGEASGRAAAGRRTECRELKSELRSAKDKSIASDKANRRGGGANRRDVSDQRRTGRCGANSPGRPRRRTVTVDENMHARTFCHRRQTVVSGGMRQV
jgi:hypothetical protein